MAKRNNITHGDIQRTGRKGRHGVHEIRVCCYNCGKVSPPVVGTSPAAPELTGLEVLEKSALLRGSAGLAIAALEPVVETRP